MNNNTNEYYNNINEAASYVRKEVGECEVALVLGSGLNNFVDNLKDPISLSYKDIPHIPQTHVVGHYGKLVVGHLPSNNGNDIKIMCFAGRVHAYEGWQPYQINFMARMASQIGVRLFILTNAAGGAQEGMTPGSIMMIRDHIRLINLEPTMDVCNDQRFGTRHISPINGWSDRMASIARNVSKELDIPIYEGTYVWCSGPTYETHSEVQAGIKMGAGAFGMSTVPEFFAAKGINMEVFGMSMATNMAAGLIDEELTHEDVARVAAEAGPRFEKVMLNVIANCSPSSKLSSKRKRDENEKHIDEKEDTTSILSTLPLRRPIWSPTLEEVVNDANVLKSILFNQPFIAIMNTTSIEIPLDNCKRIGLDSLPILKYNSFSASAQNGIISVGEYNKIPLLMLSNILPEGFTKVESSFIAQILKVIGVQVLLSIVVAESYDNDNIDGENIVGINDILDRCGGYAPLLSDHKLGQPLYDHDTRFCSSIFKSNGRYVQFPGPALPSIAEKLAVNLEKCPNTGIGITNLCMLEISRSMGICTSAFMILVPNIPCNVFADTTRSNVLSSLNEAITNATQHCNNKSFVFNTLNISKSKFKPGKIQSERIVGQEDYDQVLKSAEWCMKELECKDVDSCLIWDDSYVRLNEYIDVIKKIDCTSIPGWLENGVGGDDLLGKRWNLLLGRIKNGKRALFLVPFKVDDILKPSQRIEFEGMGYAVRMLKLINIKRVVFLSSIATCDDNMMKVGDITIIKDHVNLSGENPLFGMNEARWGGRFIDMGNLYNDKMRSNIKKKMENINKNEVIVAQVVNTALDSSAEAQFCRSIGVHAITCGLCPQVIRAHHSSIKIAALGFVIRSVANNTVIKKPQVMENHHVSTILGALQSAIETDL